MICPKCGNRCAPHAAQCARCRMSASAYSPTPEEIEIAKAQIRAGLAVAVGKTGRPIGSRGPIGGVLVASDDEERAWRRGQLSDESEVLDD